jgi:curved DNA-binding protein CbpA
MLRVRGSAYPPAHLMKNRRNYYRILHVGPEAPTAVIQASYRALMQRLKMHPDLGGDHTQAALINEAYATLSDPQLRAAYDKTLSLVTEQRRGARPAAPPRPAAAEPEPAAPPRPARTPPSTAANTAACAFCTTPYRATDADYPDSACATCGSALSPASRHQHGSGAAGSDGDAARRAIERVPRNMAVAFHLAQSRTIEQSGTTEDLSLHGMRLLTRARIPVGERLRLECSFCSAVAVVRSARADEGQRRGSWQYGVEFLTLRLKHQRGGLFSTVA